MKTAQSFLPPNSTAQAYVSALMDVIYSVLVSYQGKVNSYNTQCKCEERPNLTFIKDFVYNWNSLILIFILWFQAIWVAGQVLKIQQKKMFLTRYESLYYLH